MRLRVRNIFRKSLGLLRFTAARAVHAGRLRASGWGSIGKGTSLFVEGKGRISLGRRAVIADYAELQARGGMLRIGDHFSLNKYARIVARESIELGDHVLIAQFVTIVDHDHHGQTNAAGQLVFSDYTVSPISIGSNVWIGEKSTITKGVRIGNNVIVAAHALVNRDVPDNCVVGGVPARVLKSIPG